jgi:hypothetical protein
VNEQLRGPATSIIPVREAVSPRAGSGSIALGIVSLVFGLPGAVLLAVLLAAGSELASAWAWAFGGFWTLALAAGHALDLAVGEVSSPRQ